MSYLTTLSRVKIVLSLTMHWGANRKFRHPGPVGPGTCCAGRNCSGFAPLCDNSTPGRQECQDFLPRFIQKSFPGACLSIRICFAPVTMFCLWKRPPGPPGLMMRVIYHFVVPSGGRAPPGSICAPLPSLRSMPVVPTLPAMVSSLILEPLFSWLWYLSSSSSQMLGYEVRRKKREHPFPFLYLYLRTNKMFLGGPYLWPINPSISVVRTGSPMHV